MDNLAKQGVWPVMITPFTQSGDIDYTALRALITWYEEKGVAGLFATCQSSEMFFLSLRERVQLTGFIKKHTGLPVIASGHISYDTSDQLEEIRQIADTEVDAIILISNRFASEGDSDRVWQNNLETVINQLPDNLPLGLYECPYPYKHLLRPAEIDFCANSRRFYFLKDTCCDELLLKERIDQLVDSPLRLFNANTATLLSSLEAGAAGFSGVMANFHPHLYVWLCENWKTYPKTCKRLISTLSICSLIEAHLYPVIAKAYLGDLGLPINLFTRSKNYNAFTKLHQLELEHLREVTACMEELIKNPIE